GAARRGASRQSRGSKPSWVSRPELLPSTLLDLANIEIPTVLVDGTLSSCNPPLCNPPISLLAATEQAFAAIASQDKQLVVVQDAVHRTFNSGLCAQTQSSGAIAEADPRAILDFKTAKDALTSSTGLPMDFCTYSEFTSPERYPADYFCSDRVSG